MVKSYWKSKTIIINVLFVLVLGIQAYAQSYIIDPELQGLCLAIVNFALRFFTTQGVTVPFKKQQV